MTACSEMPRYLCHKQVWALKIKTIEQGTDPVDGGSWLLTPEEAGYAPVQVSHAWFVKNSPLAGGYYVVYEDGYASYSPAKAFENGYTPVPADHRDRVRAELAELDGRIGKLQAFFSTDLFAGLDKGEQDRMHAQLAAMLDYSGCLTERVQAFSA